nr:MAG TPA: hypothetical protein [Caudoviricetes sp.]
MSAVFFDSAWTFILVCHALNTHRFQCLSISASYRISCRCRGSDIPCVRPGLSFAPVCATLNQCTDCPYQ